MKPEALAVTPLHTLHQELGARLVPFAGYDMPLHYPLGILKEHLHARAQAGLFDVSHMGQILLRGPGAAAALERLVPVDILALPAGRQRYALFTDEQGGILDDLMVANLGNDELLLVVNAACKEQDLAHLRWHLGEHCAIEAAFASRALLALQGPQAAAVLARLAPQVTHLTFMQIARLELLGSACLVSRSGYTGEDGFEISVPAEQAEAAGCLARRKSAPSASAPAIRCAWKPACACMATTWIRRPRRSRPTCSGRFPRHVAPTAPAPAAFPVRHASSPSSATACRANGSACVPRSALRSAKAHRSSMPRAR